MKITQTPLAGLFVIERTVYPDERGYFIEMFRVENETPISLPAFTQDNLSRSKQNVLRGLHYQLPHAQGKLISCTRGKIFDVVVDIRRQSKTFGHWFGIILSDQNHHQLYVPEGFAHGFCTLSSEADVHYKCTDIYAPHCEQGILWSTPLVSSSIAWPINHPILSQKDAALPLLTNVPKENLFL